MPNRLAKETSPYLLQHAGNPVDWYPWGAEALARARAEDRPILLSIGYAACHWCHVMEHESFEDDDTAAVMNELFVNVKVDREERPDLDGIYMQAVQAMTGHGGWPMTVFLTPEGAPFYAGTYFPPEDRPGMPSFKRVLRAVADAYRERRADVERTSGAVREMFAQATERTRSTGPLNREMLDRAYHGLSRDYDTRNGGFGGAPKFPQPMSLEFLLAYAARTGTRDAQEMVLHSFRRMARGGIYDQLGGGFARYAVDAHWLVPHFEKMLYDNALLARLGVHLWQATRDTEIRRVTEETLEWAMREMTAPGGGFFSSLDADSEGEEGKFYVWSLDELRSVLGADAETAVAYWGAGADGNFEGHNILHVPHEPGAMAGRIGVPPETLAESIGRARTALYEVRARRVWPGRDEKILAGWNGLMLRALAEGARAFDRGDLRAAAIRAGDFLFGALVREGRAFRSYKDGRANIPGFLEDHASLALGALALYELTFDPVWLERSRSLADACVQWFWDDGVGAFFDTASDHERLITRPRDVTDNAVPSGTSLAVELLARLAEIRHDTDSRRRATYVAETLAEQMARHPLAFGHLLTATDMLVHGAVELALVGDPSTAAFQSLARAAGERYVPSLVMAGGAPARDGKARSSVALLADRPMVEGRATAYVCRNYACERPVTDAAELRDQLAAQLE